MNVSQTTPQEKERTQSAEEVLQATFDEYHGELLGTLFYLVGNMDDAQDALQETFVKCWRHLESVPSLRSPKAWVFQIALNTARDLRGTAWRRRRQSLVGEDNMLVSNDPGPDSSLQKQEEMERVQGAVMELRPEEKEIFLLRQNGEMTYEQIAAFIEVPVGTVKTRMRLALSKLRIALEGC